MQDVSASIAGGGCVLSKSVQRRCCFAILVIFSEHSAVLWPEARFCTSVQQRPVRSAVIFEIRKICSIIRPNQVVSLKQVGSFGHGQV